MINYGYFRHRFDASQDPKLQSLVDEIGVVALGYYYSLIEIYGSHYAQNNDGLAVTIHRRVIANVWRKRVDSCDKVLTKLQLSGLLVHTKSKNTYSIEIPNFSKYYGSYKKTTPQKVCNKSKVNKSKVKEKETVKNDFDIDLIYAEYPKKVGKSDGMKKLHDRIKSKLMYDIILHGTRNYKRYCKEENIEMKYIKQFSTFVNGEHWNDEYVSESKSNEIKTKELQDEVEALLNRGF